MLNKLKSVFSHDTDRKVDEILKHTEKTAADTAKQAKSLRDLLQKNGVTLQIYIATGGDKRSGH